MPINACDMTDGRFEMRTRPYFCGFPALWAIQGFTSSHVLLRARRHAFPLRLMSWLGFATSLEVKTQEGCQVSGVMVSRHGVPCDDLCSLGCGIDKVGFDLGMESDGRGVLVPVCEKEFGVVFTDGWVIEEIWLHKLTSLCKRQARESYMLS